MLTMVESWKSSAPRRLSGMATISSAALVLLLAAIGCQPSDGTDGSDASANPDEDGGTPSDTVRDDTSDDGGNSTDTSPSDPATRDTAPSDSGDDATTSDSSSTDTVADGESSEEGGGSPGWPVLLGTPMSDIARDVTVDSSGNVYVVGKSIQSLAGESGTDVAAILVKFDSSGNRKWTRIAGAGSAWAVAVDNSGNVFVGGGFIDDKYDDVYGEGAGAVAKFDESGNPQWLSLFGTGGNVEISRDLATDKSGAVYMAGGTRASEVGQDKNSGGTDALAASYEAAGSRQWARLLGSSKDDAASGVAVDSSGNSYFVGTAGGGLRGNPDVDRLGFLSKYDASGGRTWLKTSSSTFSTHVTTGSSGGVYLSGFTEGDVDASVPFLAKRDASGEQAWMQKLRETSDGARIADTVGVVVGNSGNIHVAGGVVTDRETTDAYVGAFDDSGTQQWSHTTDFSADIRPHSFAVDGSDNVYVVGRTYEDLAGQTNQGDSDLFVARIEK